MTKYLLYNSRLVNPEMEKPKRRNDYLDHYFEYLNAMSEYRKHLSTLPGIECSAELLAKFKDGDWLEEGKDFKLDTMAWQYGRVSVSTAEIAVPVQSDEEEIKVTLAGRELKQGVDYTYDNGVITLL